MKGKTLSTRTDKVMFLVEHPTLIGASPKIIKDALVAAGLVSSKTYALDIVGAGHHLEDEARKIIEARRVNATVSGL